MKINQDKCVLCGLCEANCPVGAIEFCDGYHIAPELCRMCGTCAENCPEGAIEEGE